MGYPHPEFSGGASLLVPRGATLRKTPLVPPGVGAELQPARRPQGGWKTGARLVSVILAMLLAVTMLPAAGLSSAYADEPVERPATSGGDVALSSTNGAATESAPQVPVAETREDGMHVADGLMFTVADGGLALVGFDGAAPEGVLSVPAAVMLDGKEAPVVAIDLAEGQVADKVVVLSLPQGIKNINTATLASAFPALLSVEVAGASSSLPVAAGAASVRAAYSASGGMLFRPTEVTLQADDGSIETVECKELVWAPPALVSARIPVECRAIAEGAFADVRGLKTIVAFGTMERIADGAFSTEQTEGAKVVIPQASAAVTDGERVSVNMALMEDAGQKERRSAWHEAGWRTDDIVMGKPYGSLTEIVAVTDEGAIERTEMQLVSYPGAHERAMDLKKPNADGIVDQAESGLAFTVKSDMTASVAWQGDKTATPSHIDIPSTIIIDGVTYPVTEIAAGALEGAAFLQSVVIPEGVTTIGDTAFANCANLADANFPATLRTVAASAFDGTAVPAPTLSVAASAHGVFPAVDAGSDELRQSAGPAASGPDGAVAGDASVPSGSRGPVAAAPDAATGAEGEESPPNDGLTTLSDDSVSSFSAVLPDGKSSTYTEIGVSDVAVGRPFTASVVSGVSRLSEFNTGFAIKSAEFSKLDISLNDSSRNIWNVRGYTSAGALVWYVKIAPIDGYTMPSLISNFTTGSPYYCFVRVGIVRSEAAGTSKLALEGHKHTASDVTSGVFGSDRLADAAVTVAKLASNSVETAKIKDKNVTGAKIADKTITDDKLASTFVKPSEFGTISYSGLDGADASVYPTSFRQGGTPALPEPQKDGSEFLGWTWAGQGTPTTDPNVVKNAFASAGAVALTANWGAPSASYFFTEGAPCRADGGEQSHTIAVKLASERKAVTGVTFAKRDEAPLGSAADGIRFKVGEGTPVGWGASAGACELVELPGGGWGVYVTVTVPAGAIDEARVASSYVDSSYVAALAKMSYTFA